MGKDFKRIIKFVLFPINFLLFILGAVMLGFGIWCVVNSTGEITFSGTQDFSTGKIIMYIFFAVGGLTMMMGFVGCFGAMKESPCLLGLYFISLLFILIIMVFVATCIFLMMNSEPEKIYLGVCIAGIIIEIMGILLSVWLCQNIK